VPLSEQDDMQAIILQMPIPDEDKWKLRWWQQGQRWRTEPEIDAERQKYLEEQRNKYDVIEHIYPFKDIKLNRADVEWLIATHKNGHWPVESDGFGQPGREGVNLHGAILRGVDLWMLPLANADLYDAHLEGANFHSAHLEGANLINAHLEGAKLISTHLEKACLMDANLERANLSSAHLEGAWLSNVHLEGAILYITFLDAETSLHRIVLSNQEIGPVSLLDVHWGDANVGTIDWPSLSKLGDEHSARQQKNHDGTPKSRAELIYGYECATRAYRQLAVTLHNQGLNEDAARFVYSSQGMQRKLFWHQRKFIRYISSLFLNILAGYGYRWWRSFVTYLLVITIFAIAYFIVGHTVGPALSPLSSLVFSMTSFHGRGFFPGGIGLDDPLTVIAAFEAFVGLLIEVTFIATLTQRLFNR